MLQDRISQVRARVQTLITQWQSQHKHTLPEIQIRFDLRGRSAGIAGHRAGNYYMRFNTDMMQNTGWEHMIQHTVPHELAHIICFHLGTDSGHGTNWIRVCKALGGNGQRCHTEAVTYAKGQTYVYTTSTGRAINLSETKHRRIQQGQSYTGRNGLGRIDRTCAYSLLGQTVTPMPTAKPTSTPRVVTGSRAAQVRAWITQGLTQAEVHALCVTELGQTPAQAQQYWRSELPKVRQG